MRILTRFLEREILTLHGARTYGKRPAAREAVTPLYSADIGEPPAKRSRTAGPAATESLSRAHQLQEQVQSSFFILSSQSHLEIE
jgi:hypothetical protein